MALYKVSDPIPYGNLCISIFDGKDLLRNYGSDIQCSTRKRSRLVRQFSRSRSKSITHIMHLVAEAEREAIWGGSGRPTTEYHGVGLNDVRTTAGKLIAGLFYAQLRSIPDTKLQSFALQVELRCRLRPGSHLNALAHAMLQNQAILHFRYSRSWTKVPLCDGSLWDKITSSNSLGVFKLIDIKSVSFEDTLEFKIEAGRTPQTPEHVGNSPCSVTDFLNAAEENLDLCSSDIGTLNNAYNREDDQWSHLDREIGHLENLLSQWR